VELGEDGRLIRLQLEELGAGLEEALRLVVLDYVAVPATERASVSAGAGSRSASRSGGLAERERRLTAVLEALHALSPDELLDQARVGSALGLGTDQQVLDSSVEARGYRLLHRLPRVSDVIIERIVERFDTLPQIMQASIGELEKVGGVGGAKARSVKNGLARLAEASILERYE
jgi:diadenylate cyclase